MDTRKALAAIIVLLVLMNLVLGAYIFIVVTGKDDITDTISYARTVLKERNYRIDCRIPENSGLLSPVVLGGNRFTEQSVASVSEKTDGTAYIDDDTGELKIINIAGGPGDQDTDRTKAEAAASEFVTSIGIDMDGFILDYFKETGINSFEIKYTAADENRNMYFDSYIKLRMNGTAVQSADIMYHEIEKGQPRQGESMPVYAILLSNLLETQAKQMTIESIVPGYCMGSPDSSIASMCWRVRFNDGSERFFNAETGMEISKVTGGNTDGN